MAKKNEISEGRPDELCRECGCRRDRMIHSRGYSCKFKPSGRVAYHSDEVRCYETVCVSCGREP